VASHNYANPIHQQESDLEKKMSATCGQKCLEQFEKFNHVGLWAKTFSALLIGMEGWYSKRCKLIWKLKGTKYNRMYFQLRPLTHHTEETEFGSLLLKTPTKMDGHVSSGKNNPTSGNSGTLAQEIMSVYQPTMKKLGLLPTPTTQEPTTKCKLTENGRRMTKDGKDSHSLNIGRMAVMGMLPTPNTRDYKSPNRVNSESTFSMLNETIHKIMLPTPNSRDVKGCTKPGLRITSSGKTQKYGEVLPDSIKRITGTTSQLSPQFVMEMMGFPTDWTLLPFLNGEQNQSKPEEMQ
jgi:hypothetical protein